MAAPPPRGCSAPPGGRVEELSPRDGLIVHRGGSGLGLAMTFAMDTAEMNALEKHLGEVVDTLAHADLPPNVDQSVFGWGIVVSSSQTFIENVNERASGAAWAVHLTQSAVSKAIYATEATEEYWVNEFWVDENRFQ